MRLVELPTGHRIGLGPEARLPPGVERGGLRRFVRDQRGGLWVPSGANAYNWSFSSVSATRPAAALGTTVTPAQNAKGSYVEVLSSANLSRDVYGLLINVNSNSASAAARDTIMDVGVDPAGGTSYSVLIANLLVSCAAPYNIGNGGVWYFFPIWVKSGSSVAVRSSVNNATVGTHRCFMVALGSPRDRRQIKVGTYVEAIGITAASSSGTAVTAGTTSEGAWTSLGTTARASWFWQFGFGVNDSTMSALAYHCDLGIGDASNKAIVIENALVTTTSSEQLNNMPTTADCVKPAPSGITVYGRAQCSGTADASLSMAGYALGG